MTQVTSKSLRESTPKGYNLVAFVDLDFDIKTLSLDIFKDQGVLVLKEAEGPLGVLRALDASGRRAGILASMAEDKQEHRFLHLVFLEHGTAVYDYKFKVSR